MKLQYVLPVISVQKCKHCGLDYRGSGVFCCSGCETVYSLLKKMNLDEFYSIQKKSPKIGAGLPIRAPSGKDFSYLSELNAEELSFFLEGIHCLSCLWLLERLPEILPGVVSSKLNIGSSILKVKVDSKKITLKAVAEFLDHIGYPPNPIEGNTTDLRRKENQTLLLRIGVAAVCAGNIMLLSISQYAGLTGVGAIAFSWISFFLTLPVMLFSATPFFQTSIHSIRSKRISIDVPIALALIAGSIVSILNLLRGETHVYFDSLAMLVLLLLSSRFLLRRMQEALLQQSPLLSYIKSDYVLKKTAAGFLKTSLEKIQPGDILSIDPGEQIPVDGKLLSPSTHTDLKFISGESKPILRRYGDLLLAGTTNISSPIMLETTSIKENTRLGQILSRVHEESILRTPLTELTDKIAKFFTYAVSFGALSIFLYFLPTNPEEGARRALALIIVACPCVLAFAAPFVGVLSLRNLSKAGIFVKKISAIEALEPIKNIVFDKTGTITKGDFHVKSWISDSHDEQQLKSCILSLEEKSHHPVAKAIVRYILNKNPKLNSKIISQYREILGVGVEGWIDNTHYEIKKIESSSDENQVGVYKNNSLVARITLGDSAREDSKEVIAWLNNNNYQTLMLSGDSQAATNKIAEEVGIKIAIGDLTPEEKMERIKSLSNSVMIGDGANDAIALAAANVSIAVEGGMDVSLKSSDIYFAQPGLKPFIKLTHTAQKYKKILWQNLLISGLYNFIGAFLALSGHIQPLTAAILMPMSSLTVFSIILIQFRGEAP